MWSIDPRLQLICTYYPATLIEIEGEALPTADGAIELSRSEIFSPHSRRQLTLVGFRCVGTDLPPYRTCGNPRSTLLVPGSGQRLVTSLARV
jgi:hypothetical protein